MPIVSSSPPGKMYLISALYSGPLRSVLLRVALAAPGDGMVQVDAARLQQAVDGREIGGVVGEPEMLEHADRRYLVEAAVELGIGFHLDGDAVLQPFCADAFAGQLGLRFRQRHAMADDAVVLRRIDQHRAPAAADVEQAFARLQPQLAADMVELVGLRLVDAVGEIREVAAAVDHALVEEEPVEIVRNVVVMLDRLLARTADEGIAAGKVVRAVICLPPESSAGRSRSSCQLRQCLELRLELALRTAAR